MSAEYLGHTVDYWLELQKRFELERIPRGSELLEEIATLRGRISFYESRVREMAFMANQP